MDQDKAIYQRSRDALRWLARVYVLYGPSAKQEDLLGRLTEYNRHLGYPLPQWELRQIVRGTVRKTCQPSMIFPEHVISGIAERFAKLYSDHLEPPLQFFCFAFLACLGSVLAGRLTLTSEIKPEPRLYILLVGESADDRKSTAAQKTTEFFAEAFSSAFSVCNGVGSAEGLQQKIKRAPGQRLLLFYDEMKAFVSKCQPESSVLLPCVNTLFESTRYETQTKNHSIELKDAHLSLLGCSTISTYQNMWSPQFIDIGFINRLFLDRLIPVMGWIAYFCVLY